MRIAILTADEPLYLPYTLEPVLRRWRKKVAFVAFVSQPIGILRRIRNFISFLGLSPFLRLTLMSLGRELLLHKNAPLPVGNLCRQLGLQIVRVRRINGESFQKLLSEVEVDLLVSVGCPQIIGKKLLALPRFGTINVHCAPLPKYRGLMPTFWSLALNETYNGVTVHFVNECIDDGPIILQRQFKIPPNDSLHEALIRAKKEAGKALLEALSFFEDGKVPQLPNPRDKATYFSFPDRKARKMFLSTGRRII